MLPDSQQNAAYRSVEENSLQRYNLIKVKNCLTACTLKTEQPFIKHISVVGAKTSATSAIRRDDIGQKDRVICILTVRAKTIGL